MVMVMVISDGDDEGQAVIGPHPEQPTSSSPTARQHQKGRYRSAGQRVCPFLALPTNPDARLNAPLYKQFETPCRAIFTPLITLSMPY